MSIPIPSKRVADFDEEERKWLRRVRGTSLAHFADLANQLAYRNGLNFLNKSWGYTYDRSNKADGAGYVMFNSDFFEHQDHDYYIDIPWSHPGASELAVILTYCAPNDLSDDLDTQTAQGAAGQSRIRLRLQTLGGTVIDPPSGTSYSWAVELSGTQMPNPRVAYASGHAYESVLNGLMTLEQGGSNQGYSATILRSLLYLKRDSPGETVLPRRLEYGSYAGSSTKMTIHIQASYSLILDACVFEIPKLFV